MIGSMSLWAKLRFGATVAVGLLLCACVAPKATTASRVPHDAGGRPTGALPAAEVPRTAEEFLLALRDAVERDLLLAPDELQRRLGVRIMGIDSGSQAWLADYEKRLRESKSGWFEPDWVAGGVLGDAFPEYFISPRGSAVFSVRYLARAATAMRCAESVLVEKVFGKNWRLPAPPLDHPKSPRSPPWTLPEPSTSGGRRLNGGLLYDKFDGSKHNAGFYFDGKGCISHFSVVRVTNPTKGVTR
ncbi:MAG: hypothetical protein ACK5TK_00035 [Betaproteobacteria bacterium]